MKTHGTARLTANDAGDLEGAAWDRLVDSVVTDTLATPFQHDTRAHWEVAGPQPVDEEFRVIVALSGGMDSATLVRMATDASLPAEHLFFDLGQPYTADELRSLDHRRIPFEVHTEHREWIDHSGIMIGRNTLIALRCAQRLAERGQWGEVWIGATAGENDYRGGDKSPRWLNDVNAMLARGGVDVRVVAPLAQLDKADQVAMAVAQGWADELAGTKSCHRADVWACGRCKTCFRKWTAFLAAGCPELVEAWHDAPSITAFAEVAEAYAAWIERPGSKYGLRRRQTTRFAIEAVRLAARNARAPRASARTPGPSR